MTPGTRESHGFHKYDSGWEQFRMNDNILKPKALFTKYLTVSQFDFISDTGLSHHFAMTFFINSETGRVRRICKKN